MPFADTAWMARGACLGQNAVFFPEQGGRANAREAKAICAICPVLDDCLTHAVEQNVIHGIWGGTTPDERRPAQREFKKQQESINKENK